MATAEIQNIGTVPAVGEAGLAPYGAELQPGVMLTIITIVTTPNLVSSSLTGSLASSASNSTAAAAFGQDIACYPDLDPLFSLLAGQANLAQSIVHRLSTRRGLLAYAPNDGFDLRLFINEGFQNLQTSLLRVQQAIDTEVEKDERVFSSQSLVTLDPVAQTMTITITLATRDGQTFSLILQVSALTVQLLQAN